VLAMIELVFAMGYKVDGKLLLSKLRKYGKTKK
jgi:hypothetical protein